MSLAQARELALEVVERADLANRVTVSRFFSGAGLAADGVQFAMVLRGSLWLRVDDASRAAIEALGATPFSYEKQARTVKLAGYYETPAAVLEDDEALRFWLLEARRAALAAPLGRRRGRRAAAAGVVISISRSEDREV